MRWILFVVIAVFASTTPIVAQDKSGMEIMTVDAACQEQNVLQCLSDVSGGCEGGIFGWYAGDGGGDFFPISFPRPACIYPDVSVASASLGFQMKLGACQAKVRDFPSLYKRNCLRPTVGERLLTATGDDLRFAFRKYCEAAQLGDCERF